MQGYTKPCFSSGAIGSLFYIYSIISPWLPLLSTYSDSHYSTDSDALCMYPYSVVIQTLDEAASERFPLYYLNKSYSSSLLFLNKALNPLTGPAI